MRLPFRIDRTAAEPLIAQMAHGIARGIETGFWKPGDVLPTLDAFARSAGVSLIVVRQAMRRLADEGRINPRPGVGTVVLEGSVRPWRGHVVIVDFETRSNYFFSRVSGILRERLIKANYLPSPVSVAAEEYDTAQLRAILRQPVSLAVVLGMGRGHDTPALKLIADAGVPFLTLSSRARPSPRSVGHVRLDEADAFAAFVRQCASAGVRRVAHVRLLLPKEYGKGADVFAPHGIACEIWQVAPFDGMDPIENVQRGVTEFFEARLSGKAPDLPDVIYFDDDYAAAAAIMSLLHHGFRIPEDVGIVTQVHRGDPPPFPLSLARIEDDPFAVGETVSALALAILEGKAVPRVTQQSAVWHPGETFSRKGR